MGEFPSNREIIISQRAEISALKDLLKECLVPLKNARRNVPSEEDWAYLDDLYERVWEAQSC